MNKAFYVCEHGTNPAECKDCKIKMLQDSLATQQEMTVDLADEMTTTEAENTALRDRTEKAEATATRLQSKIAMHRSKPEDNALYQSWMKSLEPVFVRENKRLAGELETVESEIAEAHEVLANIALAEKVEALTKTNRRIQDFNDEVIMRAGEANHRAEKAEADLAEAEKDRDKQHQQAQDAAHVLTRIPLAHEDLNVCGCTMCERVRAGMIDAGYLEPATGKDGE